MDRAAGGDGLMAPKIRPRCAYCDKPAPKLTTTVWLHSMSETTRQKNGNWYRHLYLDAPVRSIADCRRLSNQQVISVHYGMDKTISRFAEWDGELFWQSSDPCCSITCARKFARAAYKAGFRMVRAGETVA